MHDSAADSLRLELEAPAEAPSGTPITLRLRLKNEGREPVVASLKGREIAFDFVVTRPDGDTVWRRLSHEPLQEIIHLQRLAPGGELVLEDRWDQRDRSGRLVAPGAYGVRGMLFTERRWSTEQAVVTVRGKR